MLHCRVYRQWNYSWELKGVLSFPELFFHEVSRWMRTLDLHAFSNTSCPLKRRCCMPPQGWQLFTAEFVKLCGGVAGVWWIGGIVTAVTVVSSGTAALCEKLLDCLRQWTPARIGLIYGAMIEGFSFFFFFWRHSASHATSSLRIVWWRIIPAGGLRVWGASSEFI